MNLLRKPDWLKKKLTFDSNFYETGRYLRENCINTICVEAKCPNRCECFSEKTATFLILGDICTRNCRYCLTKVGNPDKFIDKNEIDNIITTILKLKLDYVVITSVTRDDLDDGGASQYVRLIKSIKKIDRNIGIEVLTPEFKGDVRQAERIINTGVSVYAINIETVNRLYSSIRPNSNYENVLKIMRFIKTNYPQTPIKSSIIVGLGEDLKDIKHTLIELRNNGCDIVIIGQYLRPSLSAIEVKKYYLLSELKLIEDFSNQLGLKTIAKPFARTSYKAKEIYYSFIKG